MLNSKIEKFKVFVSILFDHSSYHQLGGINISPAMCSSLFIVSLADYFFFLLIIDMKFYNLWFFTCHSFYGVREKEKRERERERVREISVIQTLTILNSSSLTFIEFVMGNWESHRYRSQLFWWKGSLLRELILGSK